MMDLEMIRSALYKIRDGSRASDLEGEELDFKSYPIRNGVPLKKKLSDMLSEYAVAFSNAKGGALVLGVKDNIQGPDAFMDVRDFNTDEYKKIVYNNTHPHIIVDFDKVDHEDHRIILMSVSKSPVVHSNSGGVKYKRVGKENRIIYPEEETTLRVEKGEDLSEALIPDADLSSLDHVEIARLRNWIDKHSPENDLSSLDDMKLLHAMGLMRKDDMKILPTVACLLLVGKEDVLREKISQHETIFLRFEEDDTNPVKTLYMKSPLLKTIDLIWGMVEPYNDIVTIKDAFMETPVPSFPNDVVREGLLNALTHRDYSINGSVYVKLFKDRIEISNPGGFIGGITPENVLTHPPLRRNSLLSGAFQHIGVVNKAGLGVDRMYRMLISYGKMPPEYPYFKDNVVLVIRDGNFDEILAKFVGRKAKDGHGWKLNELIIIHYLRRNDRITTSDAAGLCQVTAKEASELLISMDGRFLERYGKGKGTYYQYSKEVFRSLGEVTRYTRISGLSEERMLELIMNHVSSYGKVTNSDVREICGVNRDHGLRLLRELVSQKRIQLIGEKKGAFYIERS